MSKGNYDIVKCYERECVLCEATDCDVQFVFFLEPEGELFPIDKVSKDLLAKLDTCEIKKIKDKLRIVALNSAIVNTAMLLNDVIYNIKYVPIRRKNESAHATYTPQYMITLENQALFSHTLKNMRKMHADKSSYDYIFKNFKNGVFITNACGDVEYMNDVYKEFSNIDKKDLLNKNIKSLVQKGYFEPIVTPAILKTSRDYVTIQYLKNDKYAIVTGKPIFDNMGNPCLIISFLNIIEDTPDGQKYETFNSNSNEKTENSQFAIDVIVEDKKMRNVVKKAVKVADYDVSILIEGETGTGKEMIASLIHFAGPRKEKNFVKVNCSAIAPNLLESEIFGYEPGAFTGALNNGKLGLFEIANNGTLLLDEIGDMPYDLQAKILNVVQDKEFYRVGGTEPIKSNVKLVAATNKNLRDLVYKGLFRSDLYHRLNVIRIDVPALRERKEDIIPLFWHFCHKYNRKHRTDKKISQALSSLLCEYSWPGNVRELKNMTEEMCILSEREILSVSDFEAIVADKSIKENYDNLAPLEMFNTVHSSLGDMNVNRSDMTTYNTNTTLNSVNFNTMSVSEEYDALPLLSEVVNAAEKNLIERALIIHRNTRDAAKALGVSQSTITRKIKELGINTR